MRDQKGITPKLLDLDIREIVRVALGDNAPHQFRIDNAVERKGIRILGLRNSVDQRIVVLAARDHLLHDFQGNLHEPRRTLMLQPTPEFGNLVYWVIGAVRRNQNVRVQEVEHLLARRERTPVKEGIDVSRLHSEHLSGLCVSENAVAKRMSHKVQ